MRLRPATLRAALRPHENDAHGPSLLRLATQTAVRANSSVASPWAEITGTHARLGDRHPCGRGEAADLAYEVVFASNPCAAGATLDAGVVDPAGVYEAVRVASSD